jgi:hypothetical protein
VCSQGVDQAGNVSPRPCGNITWTVDTTAPMLSVISPANNTVTRNGTMTVTLNASEPVVGFLVLHSSSTTWAAVTNVDDVSSTHGLAEPTFVIRVSTNVTTDGWHCIQVKGADRLDNVQMIALRFCWELDTTAPNVWLSGMEELPVATASTSVSFSAHWSESGTLVWWAVDSAGWNHLMDIHSFTASLDGDGEHALHLKALDNAGNNFVNGSVWVWFLDTTPPIAHLTRAPGSPSSISTPTFEMLCSSFAPSGNSDCAFFNYTVHLASLNGCGTQKTHSGTFSSNRSGPSVLQLSGIRSGENTLKVTAVDSVGLRQVVPETFSWTVRLTGDEVTVTIQNGPPPKFAYTFAVFHVYAHRNETRLPSAVFEVKLDKGGWTLAPVLCNSSQGMCMYNTSAELGAHEIQIRAVDRVSSIAGPPALWRWTVEECSDVEYAFVNVTNGHSLVCEPCPPGGDCTAKNATVHSLVAKAGWWAPPPGPRLKLYRCPLPSSCAGNGLGCDESLGFSNSTVCGQCLATHVRQGDRCTSCPELGKVICSAV